LLYSVFFNSSLFNQCKVVLLCSFAFYVPND
jgi:hypothetical protein